MALVVVGLVVKLAVVVKSIRLVDLLWEAEEVLEAISKGVDTAGREMVDVGRMGDGGKWKGMLQNCGGK